MTSNTASNAAAALAAAMGDTSTASSSHRRSLGSRKGLEPSSMGSGNGFGSYTSRSYGTSNEQYRGRTSDQREDSAVVDGGNDEKGVSTKNRNRRASEGSHLSKGEGKRHSNELRCDTCGKASVCYSHECDDGTAIDRCRWEHDPAWAYTSKLLISKHQQVQLLEAASVLVNMPMDGSTPPETPRVSHSDESSASPTASGSSEFQDELSSTETTPPPMSEEPNAGFMSSWGRTPKRDSAGSAFSRSYQSNPSSSFAGSAPSPSPGFGFAHYRNSSTDQRPTTSGLGRTGADDVGLAAAAELLNFGTPRTGATHMSSDIPPVPPLPARFQAEARLSGHTPTPTAFSPLGSHPVSDAREVKIDHFDHAEEDDFEHHAAPHDEDEDGVFGRMEE